MENTDTNINASPDIPINVPIVGRADYDDRRAARINRLESRAQKTAQAASARFNTAHEIGSHIPFGQPILVGHHSEGRHRRDAEKIQDNMRKGCELLDKAKQQEWTAEGAANNTAISSDNPDAMELLREKLADLEANHEHSLMMRKARTALARGTLDKCKVPDQIKEEAKGPIPPFARSSSNVLAKIKATRDRIAQLEKMAAQAPQTDVTIDGITVIDNLNINRVQIIFPGKPSDEIRDRMKARGFRWAPSNGAWQRLRSPGVFDLAVWLVGKIEQ